MALHSVHWFTGTDLISLTTPSWIRSLAGSTACWIVVLSSLHASFPVWSDAFTNKSYSAETPMRWESHVLKSVLKKVNCWLNLYIKQAALNWIHFRNSNFPSFSGMGSLVKSRVIEHSPFNFPQLWCLSHFVLCVLFLHRMHTCIYCRCSTGWTCM